MAEESGPLVTRPANIVPTTSEVGREVNLFANFIRLKTTEGLAVHQYHVEFEPSVESPRLRRALLMGQIETTFSVSLFDGTSNLKTLLKLPNEKTLFSAIRRTDNVSITMSLQYAGEVEWGAQEMLRLYNTQMRQNMRHLGFVQLGRHFFHPDTKTPIDDFKLDIWAGVVTAINKHDAGTLMVVNAVHKVVRQDTVLDMMKEASRGGTTWIDEVRRQLAGTIVATFYNRTMTYKIDDVDTTKNPTHTFNSRGKDVTFMDYYRNQYGIEIKDPKQPLLQVKRKARKSKDQSGDIYLIPELCVMTGLTPELKKDFNLKKKMDSVMQVAPKARFDGLGDFVRTVKTNKKICEDMQKWGLEFDANHVHVKGQELPAEKILMRDDNVGISYDKKSGEFSKEIRSKKMRSCPSNLGNWAIVFSKRDESVVEDFATTLARVCGPLGMIVSKAICEVTASDRTGDFVNACIKVSKENKGLMIIVAIVPNSSKERYDSIKKLFCCDIPIPSQVIIGRTLSKKPMLMSICTKIAVQMVAKMGGVPWELLIKPKNVMVIGYDTYHDLVQKNRSVGGFVCSLNGQLSKWHSRASYHSNHEEMSSHFATNVEAGLKRYYEVNNQLPERLIIYRDGVGEGQIRHVFNFEVKQVRRALELIKGGQNIKLTFVIVTKRVNARFFLHDPPKVLDNPLPGTVVDTVVTRPERYEYYLVSQSTRQGTVTPTCYNVIVDESGWQQRNQQAFAFSLCHLYYNWPGTISVPAPCQYAHKLAFLVGTSFHEREPSLALSDQLFYL